MDQVIVGAGHVRSGTRILIVDDVITTGGTKVEAIEKLRIVGEHKIVGLVLAVDRQEKMGNAVVVKEKSAVQSIEDQYGFKVFSILDMQTIFDLVASELDDDIRNSWISYYDKYGIVSLK